jgi:hypothetical protein
VDIRLVSSLTDDDEDRFAAIVLSALVDLLNRQAIAYSVRIETDRGIVLQHNQSVSPLAAPAGAAPPLST